MGEAVQQGPGHALVAHHLGPLLEGQVGGDQQAGALVGAGHHLEEELGAHLGKRHVAQLVQHEQLLAFQLFVKTLQGALLAALQQLGHQGGDRGEAHAASLGAGGAVPRAARIGHGIGGDSSKFEITWNLLGCPSTRSAPNKGAPVQEQHTPWANRAAFSRGHPRARKPGSVVSPVVSLNKNYYLSLTNLRSL